MEGDMQRELGRRVRAHRQALRLSQEKLAERVGKSRAYVGQIERGECNLSLRSVEWLAGELGLEPMDLLDDR